MWGFAAPHPPRPAAPRPGEAAETARGGARGPAPRAAAPEAPGARSAPPAARTPANFPRRPPPAPTPARGAAAPPPARVRTASPRRVAGGRLGGGPRAPLRLTRRVTRTATLGRGDASGPPRGSGAPVAPPALVHGASAAPGSQNMPRSGAALAPPRRCLGSSPRPHRSRLRDPSERPPGRRPRDGRSVRGGAPRSPGVPHAGRNRPRECLPRPRPHAPVPAVPSLSYILQYCRW